MFKCVNRRSLARRAASARASPAPRWRLAIRYRPPPPARHGPVHRRSGPHPASPSPTAPVRRHAAPPPAPRSTTPVRRHSRRGRVHPADQHHQFGLVVEPACAAAALERLVQPVQAFIGMPALVDDQGEGLGQQRGRCRRRAAPPPAAAPTRTRRTRPDCAGCGSPGPAARPARAVELAGMKHGA